MDQSDSNAANPVRRSRRRWVQFSLRGFLVLLTVFAIWFGMFVNAAHRQRQARLHVEKLGGKSFYDFQIHHFSLTKAGYRVRYIRNARPATFDFLCRLLGDDYCSQIVFVNLKGLPITDADLVPIGSLHGLEYLDLTFTPITDDGLDSVENLSSLRNLLLSPCQHSKARVTALRESLPTCQITVRAFKEDLECP